MANRDYYEVLGIDKNATEADIKRAYRRMARKYHPDLNKEHPKEAEENFKKVNEAYHVLSDADKRAQYDQMGHDAFRQAAQNGGGPDQEVSAELAVLISAALVAEQAVLTSAIFSICLAEVGEGAEMVRNRGRISAMIWKLLFVRRPVVFIRPLL